MTKPDLNLLITLDVLLAECSVAQAAKRLRLSPSAMSRALARLREATGDPLLVRAGRRLVPTPRALELRGQAGRVAHEAEALLRPATKLDLAQLDRTFSLRTREGFVESFGPGLIALTSRQAPGVRLRFMLKPDKESTVLRNGEADLETGVVTGEASPEIRSQALFRDRFIGVVRNGHDLEKGEITPERFAAGKHVAVARRDTGKGLVIDAALAPLGLERQIATTVGGFSSALALVRSTDFIATVPEKHTIGLRQGMTSFQLPFPSPVITVSLLWHPRLDADPAHRWLRNCVREVCAARLAGHTLPVPAADRFNA